MGGIDLGAADVEQIAHRGARRGRLSESDT